MALRCKRKLGSGRFRGLTSVMVLVLQVVVVGLVDANNRRKVASSTESLLLPAPPAFQSFCSNILEGNDDVSAQVASLLESPDSKYNLCLRIQGGRLGFWGPDNVPTLSTVTIEEHYIIEDVDVKDADSSTQSTMDDIISLLLPASPAFESHCSQVLEGSEDVMLQIASQSKRPDSNTFGRCLKLRGGRLGFWGVETRAPSASSGTATLEEMNTTASAKEDDDSTVDDSTTESISDESVGTTKASDLPPSSRKYIFSLFQENDGSQNDPDSIPNRYLKMQNNKRKEAKAALKATLKWREENDIDTILARPHPKYDICKTVFPHYFCGRDETNHVILLQRPGFIDLKVARRNGITGQELLFHYIYVMEYLWQILEPTADETMTSIMDLQGISLSILRKPELLKIVQMFCTVMDSHFPQRGHKMIVINAPKWFGTIYKVISPLLRETTKERIFIYTKGKAQEKALASLLQECGGPEDTRNMALEAPTDMERGMRDFCLARLDDAGVKMQKVA